MRKLIALIALAIAGCAVNPAGQTTGVILGKLPDGSYEEVGGAGGALNVNASVTVPPVTVSDGLRVQGFVDGGTPLPVTCTNCSGGGGSGTSTLVSWQDGGSPLQCEVTGTVGCTGFPASIGVSNLPAQQHVVIDTPDAGATSQPVYQTAATPSGTNTIGHVILDPTAGQTYPIVKTPACYIDSNDCLTPWTATAAGDGGTINPTRNVDYIVLCEGSVSAFRNGYGIVSYPGGAAMPDGVPMRVSFTTSPDAGANISWIAKSGTVTCSACKYVCP